MKIESSKCNWGGGEASSIRLSRPSNTQPSSPPSVKDQFRATWKGSKRDKDIEMSDMTHRATAGAKY